MSLQHHQHSLAAIIVLALIVLLALNEHLSSNSGYNTDEHRSLRVLQRIAPDAYNEDAANNATTITIYLTDRSSIPTYSFFKTDMLQRFGSGRVIYAIRATGSCHTIKRKKVRRPLQSILAKRGLNSPAISQTTGSAEDRHHSVTIKPFISPDVTNCIALGRDEPYGCTISHIKAGYPQCKTFVTNDEFCKFPEYDFRQYYSTSFGNTKGYLPLGPRQDSWRSFHKIRQEPNFVMLPPSKRRYAFNAIFSQDTNARRMHLAQVIKTAQQQKMEEEDPNKKNLEVYAKMARQWRENPNSASNDLVSTDTYMRVVLDSTFTLAPAGHNPECFRIYEAIEAGSIPVLVRRDIMDGKAGACQHSLAHWVDAPIVILESWNDLYPTVSKMLDDLEALDEMQVKLRVWYEEYMTTAVREFDDMMLETNNAKDSM